MDKKTVLVTGATGMLGKDVMKVFSGSPGLEVTGLARKSGNLSGVKTMEADLTDFMHVRRIMKDLRPDLVIHCAAQVNVDACEKDPAGAERLHVLATSELAAGLNENARMIYVSTDSVFDGEKGNYTEGDEPRPLNEYAKTKYRGEVALRQSGKNHLIVRTNIYGFHRPAGNSLCEWALKKLAAGEKAPGFNDVFFNPLYTAQLARMLMQAWNNDMRGTVHFGSVPAMSKYDFLLKLADAFGYPRNMVEPASVDSVKFTAPRPRNTALALNLAEKAGIPAPSLADGLAEMKKDMFPSEVIA